MEPAMSEDTLMGDAALASSAAYTTLYYSTPTYNSMCILIKNRVPKKCLSIELIILIQTNIYIEFAKVLMEGWIVTTYVFKLTDFKENRYQYST